MGKKFWIAFPVTFVLLYVLEFILHAWILSGLYQAHPGGFLSDEQMQSRMWALSLGFLLWAYIWTYFFSRFATQKTVGKGIQHGVSYMIFLFVPMGFVNYATLVISGWAFFWWAVGAVIEGIIIGAVMGAIMKETPSQPAVQAPGTP